VITIGTGSFISVNVGPKPLSSSNGCYPIVVYKSGDKEIHCLHCSVSCAGIALEWAKSIGLFDSFDQIDDILNKTKTSNGVYFVPAFGLFTMPDKTKITTGFIGLRASTSKADMLRAIIDSIGFSLKLSMDSLLKDLKILNIQIKQPIR
jgi:glycerol kinase